MNKSIKDAYTETINFANNINPLKPGGVSFGKSKFGKYSKKVSKKDTKKKLIKKVSKKDTKKKLIKKVSKKVSKKDPKKKIKKIDSVIKYLTH